nr:hypothetical protein [Angustibacter aerolatus]
MRPHVGGQGDATGTLDAEPPPVSTTPGVPHAPPARPARPRRRPRAARHRLRAAGRRRRRPRVVRLRERERLGHHRAVQPRHDGHQDQGHADRRDRQAGVRAVVLRRRPEQRQGLRVGRRLRRREAGSGSSRAA